MFNWAIDGNDACYIKYDQSSQTLALLDDRQTSWMGGTINQSAALTVSNSQCSLDVKNSKVMSTGNTLTLQAAVSFLPAFIGTQNVYTISTDYAGQSSGWQLPGQWLAYPAASAAFPSPIVPITPSNHSGSAQTLTFQITSPNGSKYIEQETFVIGSAPNQANPCAFTYYRGSNILVPISDDGMAWKWSEGLPLGHPGTVGNSHCTLNTAAPAGASASGLYELDLKLAINLISTYTNPHIYDYVVDHANHNTGYLDLGAWSVSAIAPTAAVSVSAPVGGEATPTITLTGTSVNGADDIAGLQLIFNWAVDGSDACYIRYDRSQPTIQLLDDRQTTWSAVSNSQCSLDVAASGVARSGNTVTITPKVTFSNTFIGPQNVYVITTDNQGLSSGWQLGTSWTAFPATTAAVPSPITASSDAPSAATQNITFEAKDLNGYKYIEQETIVIGSSPTQSSPCAFTYYRGTNTLVSMNDTGTAWLWSGGLSVGSTGTVGNAQCTVNTGLSSARSPSANLFDLNLNITLASTYTGRNIYDTIVDHANNTTNAQLLGTWGVASSLALSVNTPVTVGSAAGAGSVTVNTSNGVLWSATSDSSWLTVSPASGGTNPATSLGYSYSQNTSAQRTATITVAPTNNSTIGSRTLVVIQVRGSTVIVLTPSSFSLPQGATKTIVADRSVFWGAASYGTLSPNGQPSNIANYTAPSPLTQSSATFTVTDAQDNQNQATASISLFASASLTVAKTHVGNFTQGQSGTYTITVTNAASAGATTGSVTVVESLPSTLTLQQMSGAGWACSGGSCSRSDVLQPGYSYPPITVQVLVGTSATSPQLNQVTVSGGGSPVTGSATDSVQINTSGSQAATGVSFLPTATTVGSQVFTTTFSNPGGGSNITSMELQFNSALNAPNSCWVLYTSAGFQLRNDAGTAFSSAVPAGSALTLSNSQCTLNVSGSSVSANGLQMSMTVSLTASSSFYGNKYAYMRVANASINSGWVNSSTTNWWGYWNPPSNIALTMNPVVGSSFYLGAGQSALIQSFINQTPNTAVTWTATCGVPNNCGSVTVGSSSTIYTAPASIQSAFWVTVTATSQADPTISAYVQVSVQLPNASGPTLSSVTPINYSSHRSNFILTVTDPGGFNSLKNIAFDFSPSVPQANPAVQSCNIFYTLTPSGPYASLDSDVGQSSWVGDTPVGVGGSDLSNSTCILHGATSAVSVGGSYLSLDIEFKVSGTYRYAYLWAQDSIVQTNWLYFGWISAN